MRSLTFKVNKYTTYKIKFNKLKNNKLYTLEITNGSSTYYHLHYSTAYRIIGVNLGIDLELFLNENCYKKKNGVLYFEQKTLDKIIPQLESIIILNTLIEN